MEVHFAADVEKKLNDLAARSGCRTVEILEDALVGYLDEVAETQSKLGTVAMTTSRGGRVKPIDGEEAFSRLKANTEAQRNGPS